MVYSGSMDQHIHHLSCVLEVLENNQLVANRKKCVIGKLEIEYLGHVISHLGVSADEKKVQAMLEWPTPRSVKELRGFLGLTGYYRRFVKDYGRLAKPLTEKIKKNNFSWGEDEEQAFQQLKAKMVDIPVLALPDFSRPFVVEADASGQGMGVVLMQDQWPIAYFS